MHVGILQAPGRLGASRASRGLQGPPGASRGLQGAPEGSRGLQPPPPKTPKNLLKPDFERKMRPPRTAKASNPGRGRNFTWDGQAGLGHPPWGGAGLRSGQGLEGMPRRIIQKGWPFIALYVCASLFTLFPTCVERRGGF